jgi:VWFA-related protein
MIRLQLLIVFLCAPLVLAQTQDPQQPLVLTTSSTVVLVPAMVTTGRGEPVFTLSANDFTLTDDGVSQPLTLEENNGDEPLALVVAIETGSAGAGKLNKYQTLPLMVETIVGNVPRRVAVVTFDSTPKLIQNFTSDPEPVEAALRNLTPGDSGAAILDTLGYAVDLLKAQPPQYRRAILLLSETLDQGSRLKLEDALREISDTNTAIYSLGFSSIKSAAARRSAHAFKTDTPGPRHGCMAKETAADPGDSQTEQTTRSAREITNQAYDCLGLLAPPLALAKMAVIAGMSGLQRNVPETVAQLTGGEYFPFKDTRSLERDLEIISNHVPNRYMLSFHPQSPHPGLHAVTLRLKNYPNLELSARNSYWAESEPTAKP